MIDLVAELVAALGSEAVVARLVEKLGPAVATAVLARIEEREQERMLGLEGLAALLGCSKDAARMRVQRDHELAALALRVGARRAWRRGEVLQLLERRRPRPAELARGGQ